MYTYIWCVIRVHVHMEGSTEVCYKGTCTYDGLMRVHVHVALRCVTCTCVHEHMRYNIHCTCSWANGHAFCYDIQIEVNMRK